MADNTIDQAKERMIKAVDNLSNALLGLRTGRANTHVLDRITVDYYGVPTPLSQMATIAAPDARLITVSPFDPSQISAIEKAIQRADIGINPTNDGKIIRLAVPQLTEERRKELVRQAHKYGEEAKVAVRNVRRKAVSMLKDEEKQAEMTEDDLKDAEKEIQKITDEQITEIESLIKNKEKDILEV